MMRKRGRAWRVGKWAGVTACALVISVWATSFVSYARLNYDCGSQISLGSGSLRYVGPFEGPPGLVADCIKAEGQVKRDGLIVGNAQLCWMGTSCLRNLLSPEFPKFRAPSVTTWRITQLAGQRTCENIKQSSAVLPLWVPLLLFAIPTGVLWYRDRRRFPAGHCRRCGYDLTKNESGVCPECGAKIVAREIA